MKRKRGAYPSGLDLQVAKKMRCIDPDTPLPSIEPESLLEPDLDFDEDHADCKLHLAPIVIDDGVIVGFWFTDRSGNGKQLVYPTLVFD